VGNGPSAAKHAAEIDTFEFVVRMSAWVRYFPKWGAGRKCSAWASPCYPKDKKQIPPGKGYEVWMTCPKEWHKGNARYRHAERIAAPRRGLIRVCPLGKYMALRQALRISTKKSLPPSTGILAISMALGIPEIGRITLFGFDAGAQGVYRYSNGRKGRMGLHPFAAEARVIDELAQGVWLGERAPKSVEWRRP
jgi:hypothetical protein